MNHFAFYVTTLGFCKFMLSYQLPLLLKTHNDYDCKSKFFKAIYPFIVVNFHILNLLLLLGVPSFRWSIETRLQPYNAVDMSRFPVCIYEPDVRITMKVFLWILRLPIALDQHEFRIFHPENLKNWKLLFKLSLGMYNSLMETANRQMQDRTSTKKNDEYPIKVTRELELYGRGDESSGRSMASLI